MKLVQTLLFAFISLSVFGQEYQRMYRLGSDISMEVIDSAKDDAGSTYVLSRTNNEVDTIIPGLLLAKHNLKGDRDWSIDIVIDEEYEIQRFGDMQSIGVDSFLISFSAKKDTSYYQALLRTSSIGEVEWCYDYIQNPDDSSVSRPVEIAVRDTSTIFLATCRIDSTESMSIWQIDNEGQPTTAEYNYVLSDTIQIDSLSKQFNSSFSEITYSPLDTTIIVSGKMFDDTTSLFVAKLDADLNQVWARSYALPQMEEGQVYEQLITSEGDIILIGTARPDFYRGFLMSLDSQGNVNWYNTVFNADPSAFGTYLFAGTLSQEENIVIGGTYLENFVYSRPFLVSFDKEGNKLWEKQYFRAALQQLNLSSGIPQTYEYLTVIEQGNVLSMPDGGFMFSTTQQDDFTVLQRTGLLIKTDNEGNSFRIQGELSTCDEDINLVSGTTELIVDSLVLIRTEIDSLVEELSAVNEDLSNYTTPVLGFDSEVQCPDSINVLLDATLMDATMYEWSTGDTVPAITVTDDEEYTITVTFDTDLCFQLCDTFVAPLFPMVEGFIDIDRSRWCTDREFDLEIFGAGGDGDYTFLWDEGETTKTVVRTEPDKEYSVLVTDGCGQDTTLTRFISLANFEQPDNAAINIDCADGSFVLTLLSSGNFVVDSTIVWSTGDTGVQSIIVEEEGEYSVTFVDDCMYTVSATANTTDITNVMLSFDDSSFCADGVVFITAVLAPQSFFNTDNIAWSTGANDDGKQSIIVTDYDMTYTVTITDNCDNQFIEEITIPDLSQEPEVLTLDAQCTEDGWIYTITNNPEPEQIIIATTEWTDALGNILAQGTQNLTLPNAQTVTVTAIDDCQNEVTATITEEQLMSQSMESIQINVEPDICMEPQMIELTAIFTGGVDPSSIQWLPNGETTTSISVSEAQAGTYIVDAIDECGFPLSAEVTIDPSDFYEIPTLTLSKQCGENETTLSVVTTGDIEGDFTWSSDSLAVGPSVVVDSVGTYIVSISDICGNVVTDSISVNAGDFHPCQCVQWPNFLYIDGDTERDQTFGPVNYCGELVDNYKMYIYNAYGNLVYESADGKAMLESITDLDDNVVFASNWNGNFQNNSASPLTSGVYMYYSTYTIEGETVEKKGDVTLIR